MNSDESLQFKVTQQIAADPLLRNAHVSVQTRGHELVVSGSVDLYFKKALVCATIRKLSGIKSIDDQIVVEPANDSQHTDSQISQAIAEKFEKNFGSSHKHIEVAVNHGHVILGGTLKWKYQKLLATDCIAYIDGIRSIQNNISTATEPEPSVTEKDILAAIYSEELIQSNINISLDLHTVAILGNVPTLFQKKLVEKIVRGVPGVKEIDNRLQVVKNKKTNS
ncbi:MAG TPA: BON domain-containing protein [Flavobacterium sp.]|jgi:osmotically-inducible protein OsmY|nr:BON domain-containing protein [Flavobacterium sp.]